MTSSANREEVKELMRNCCFVVVYITASLITGPERTSAEYEIEHSLTLKEGIGLWYPAAGGAVGERTLRRTNYKLMENNANFQ